MKNDPPTEDTRWNINWGFASLILWAVVIMVGVKHFCFRAIPFVAAFSLACCAHTSFYRDGQCVARFEGDMTNVKASMAKDGSFVWEALSVNHSAATLAQGTSASNKISAVGVATAGVAYLIP